jgi:hypothetical protein
LRDRFVEIDGILVDIPALLAISYTCDPLLCRDGNCCCSCYEITLSENELSRVIGYLPWASRFAPGILVGDNDSGTRCFDNLFDESDVEPDDASDAGELIIDTDENGLCRIAYIGEKGETFCSLHSAALERDISYFKAKPTSCVLWPLAVDNGMPQRITVQPDAYEFPCCSRNETGVLSESIAEILGGVFGEDVLRGVLAEIQKQPQ